MAESGQSQKERIKEAHSLLSCRLVRNLLVRNLKFDFKLLI